MMDVSDQARARASCSRCYKRKKRCDRMLPCCKNCQSASVRCSFHDEDGRNASYPIAYVRELEEKVRQMQEHSRSNNRLGLSSAGEASPISRHGQSYQDGSLNGNMAAQLATNTLHPAATSPDMEGYQRDPDAEQAVQGPQQMWASAGVGRSPNFAQELRTLSFEAAAERHLGSTSGLSFAKLTQKILRRLTPDKADFVFAPNLENAPGASIFNFDSPSQVFNDNMYESLSGSISVHPLLFGDLFLADLTETPIDAGSIAWPSDEPHVRHLVDFYFAHSHTLYPILVKREVMQILDNIRGEPQNLAAQSPLQNFRLWMVLAIGSTAYSSISLTEEFESRVYYNKALQYVDQVLEGDDLSALEAIMLQVSYSFFNQLGPNTWFLVGTAARLALGLGLNTSSAYDNVPIDLQQRRKRLFFSVYMMDRVVSVALGRPFAIHDDDVDVSPFDDIDEDCPGPDGRQFVSLHPTTMAVPLHILKLRQIASKISRQVYPTRRSHDFHINDPRDVLTSLHQELLEWRRNMPFPLPDTDARVPHLNTLWYDFNYYTHLAMIYRPSPLSPSPDLERIRILQTAATMSLRQAYAMHQQRRFAYNWLNFLSIFTATLSLVYAITSQPTELHVVLKQTKAISDLELAIQLFNTFEIKFAAARNIRRMVSEIARRYNELLVASS